MKPLENNFAFETAFHSHLGQQAGRFLDSLLSMSSTRAVGLLCAGMTLAMLLTGCGVTGGSTSIASSSATGESIQGRVQGGQTPVIGTHVYLFAANTTGYGSPSVSLLQASSTGHSDSLGAYVLTDSTGAFTIDGDYSCKPDTQVYLYGLGGNPGAGTNSAAGFLAILGNCSVDE